MRFVKTVAGKRNHDFKNIGGVLFGKAVFKRAFDKFFLFSHKDFRLFLSHCTAKHIRAAKRKSCDFLGNLHNLFLIDHNAVSFF